MKTEELRTLLDILSNEEAKFNEGNNAAGSRMRKTLQEIKKAAQAFRIEILEKQKANKASK